MTSNSPDIQMLSDASNSPDIQMLSDAELDLVNGGLDIGPIHIESGKGLFTIGIGGYGIWGGQGCLGVYTPDRVVGGCIR
jgi:hypothetical protein